MLMMLICPLTAAWHHHCRYDPVRCHGLYGRQHDSGCRGPGCDRDRHGGCCCQLVIGRSDQSLHEHQRRKQARGACHGLSSGSQALCRAPACRSSAQSVGTPGTGLVAAGLFAMGLAGAREVVKMVQQGKSDTNASSSVEIK